MAGSGEYVPVWKLRQIVGVEAAEKLLDACGGDKVFVAANPSARSKVSRIIGIEAARLLGDYFRVGERKEKGLIIELPRGEHSSIARWRLKMAAMIDDDATDAAIIAATGVTARTIRRWRARLGKSKHRQSGPEHPELAQLIRDGRLTNSEIALRLGISCSTVERWRRRLKGARDFELANEFASKSWPPQISQRKAG